MCLDAEVYVIEHDVILGMRIFLVGLPGSGKSHWGKIWAAESGLDFIDLDQDIEAVSGQSIKEIFASKGEKGFREWEQKTLSDIVLHRNEFIMACGGGTPCFANNMEVMNQNGLTIFIHRDINAVQSNIEGDEKTRPLLEDFSKDELGMRLKQLLDQRMNQYAKAQITITDAELHPETLKNKVSEQK